jgi:putative hydrolase of the HAD superfamily
VEAWNYILKDFPKHRLDFLKHLRDQNKYKLFLLSNTNEMHIEYVQKNVSFFGEFKSCFDGFYLSHEIGIRKPDQHIYDYVLKQNDLNPHECLFIDDTRENIEAAKVLGIHTWNIDETQEDVVDLFSIKSLLF